MLDQSILDWRSGPPISVRTIALVGLAGIAIGVLPWQTTLFVVLAAVSFWCGLRHRDWGLGLLAFSIPVQAHLQVGIDGLSLTWTKVIAWALIIGWVFWLLGTQNRVAIDFVTVSIFVLVLALTISVWNARSIGFWMGETYRWLIAAVIASLAFDTFRRGGSPLAFLLGTLAGVICSVMLAVWQVVDRVGPASFEVRGFLRAYGPFTHPNQLAIYLELGTPLFLALFIGTNNGIRSTENWGLDHRLRPVWAVGFLVGSCGLLLSQSRGGLVGMMIASIVVIGLGYRKLRPPILRYAPLGAVSVFVAALSIGLIASGTGRIVPQETLVTPANFAVQERLNHWNAAIQMAKAHPWVGVGAGNYDENYRDVTQVWRFRIGRGHAHDTYLHFLAQSGVVGLTVYLVMILGVASILIRSMRSIVDDDRLSLLIGATGVTAAVCVHGVFEYVHVLSLTLPLVILWALATAIGTDIRNYDRR